MFYRRHRHIYDLSGTDGLFAAAIKDNLMLHISRCPEYAAILRERGFDFNDLRGTKDIHKIPPLTTLYLKRHTLYSTAENRLMFRSTTSGTSGQVSVMGLDFTTLFRGAGMVTGTFFTHKIPSINLTNYVILGYEPSNRNKTGAARTAYATTFAAPALHRAYTLTDAGDRYEFNLDGLIETMIQYEKQRRPVRFMGFPAYLMFLLKEL